MRTAIIVVAGTILLVSTGCGPVHERKWNPYGYHVGPTVEEMAFFWTRPFKRPRDQGHPQAGYTYPRIPHLTTEAAEPVVDVPVDGPMIIMPDTEAR